MVRPIHATTGDADDIPEAQLVSVFSGVSRLSGQVLSERRLASPHTGILRVAARAASRRDGRNIAPDTIAVERAELRDHLSLLSRILLYILPTWLAGLFATTLVGNLFRELMPARSVVLRHDPIRPPRVTETLSLQLGGIGQHGRTVDASGTLEVMLEIDADDTRKMLRRTARSAGPVEAGYLLLPPTTKAVWSDTSAGRFGSGKYLHPKSPLILCIGDLRSDVEMRDLETADNKRTGEVTGVREVACRIPFGIPTIANDAQLADMFMVSPEVSPEGETDRVHLTITIDPEIERYRLGDLQLARVELRFPATYPPIRGIRVMDTKGRARRRADAVSIPDVGSTAIVNVNDGLSLAPGESAIIEVQFHLERGPARRGGSAELELQFNYGVAIGLPGHAVLAYPGGRARLPLPIERGHLALHAHADVDLSRLKFRERSSEAFVVEAERSYLPSMADILRLSSMLADEQIILRQILQAPPPGYPEPGGFACDLYGRDETNLSGADVHIRVLRDASATRTDPPPVRFEVTVMARVVSNLDPHYLTNVSDAIRRRLQALSGSEALQPARIDASPTQASGHGPSVSHDADRIPVETIDRLETLVVRLEHGLERLDELIDTARLSART